MFDSIITPTIASSPLLIWAAMSAATIGWFYSVLLEKGNFGEVQKANLVILGAVSVTAIDHHHLPLSLLPQGNLRSLYVLGAIVRAPRTSAKNNEAVLVTGSAGDCGKALLSHTHKVMRMRGREDSIDSNAERAIGTVLEANRERNTRCELTVEL